MSYAQQIAEIESDFQEILKLEQEAQPKEEISKPVAEKEVKTKK